MPFGGTTYADTLAGIARLDDLLVRLGLPVVQSDRIHTAATLVRGLQDALEEHGIAEYVTKHDRRGKVFFSLTDLLEMNHILDHVDGWDEAILRDKLEKLLGGSHLPQDESAANTVARDTMFELSLAAEFKRCGYPTELCEPRPDVRVNVGSRSYLIECKRVFGASRLLGAVKKARGQLRDGLGADAAAFGLIAVSVSRTITGGDSILYAGSEPAALARADRELLDLSNHNQGMWERISESRIVGVVLHFACPAAQRSGGIAWMRFLHVRQIRAGWAFPDLSRDLDPLVAGFSAS
jgi:hypothetical protein